MAYASFSQFLDALEKAGELTRVSIPVGTELAIAEWANREMKSAGGGKALLFEQPTIDGKPSKFPLAINTMGSEKRMAMALRVEKRWTQAFGGVTGPAPQWYQRKYGGDFLPVHLVDDLAGMSNQARGVLTSKPNSSA